MEVQFQELIEKIRKDGVDTAKEEASAIVAKAEGEREGILADAEREARSIRAAAAVAGALVILCGHGLNMALNVLSVIIHATRLNILEFSCNLLGMQWSGTSYEPFRITCPENGIAR